MADEAVIEIIDGLPKTDFEGKAYRHVAPEYHPLSTEGARALGGRWNPPNSFPVLYLALDEKTVGAELRRHAERHGMQPEAMLPRVLYRYQVRLGSVLDLTASDALAALELTGAISSDDMTDTQAVGEAAHYIGLEGLLAPSVTSAGQVLPVFFDQLSAESLVDPIDSRNWDTLPDEGSEPEGS